MGLSDGPIRPSPVCKHRAIHVDAWGGAAGAEAETQFMLAEVMIPMTLIHFDMSVLRTCIGESMGGSVVDGTLQRAGVRLGGNSPRFAANNHYIGLNITSPDGGLPWRFYFCYLMGTPAVIPLGTEKSVVQLNWKCIPFTQDPYGSNGLGANGFVLYDHVLDT